jgi:hypothetical protein
MNKLAEIGAALIGGALHHAEAVHGGDLSAIENHGVSPVLRDAS